MLWKIRNLKLEDREIRHYMKVYPDVRDLAAEAPDRRPHGRESRRIMMQQAAGGKLEEYLGTRDVRFYAGHAAKPNQF